MTCYRFIFCAFAIGLMVTGANAQDRTCQADPRDDEGAVPQIVKVDVARCDQARPVKIGHAREFATGLRADCTNLKSASRGAQWTAVGGTTLHSLHTLLLE